MGDSLWWAIVTITTIGYGDYYPVTVPGRWAAAALMVGGFAVLSMVTAAVSSWLIESVTAATNLRKRRTKRIGSEELPASRPRSTGSMTSSPRVRAHPTASLPTQGHAGNQVHQGPDEGGLR